MRNFTELYRMDLPHRAISVYRYLADRANKDGICWPSIPTISNHFQRSAALRIHYQKGYRRPQKSGAGADRTEVSGEWGE